MRDRRSWVGAACLILSALPALAADASRRTRPEPTKTNGPRDSVALAATIDRMLAAAWTEAGVVPVGPADDAEYLRRVYLDLVGRIPRAAEAQDFLDDPTPDKRARLVERLLASPLYLARATELWRQLLLPEAETEDQARFAAPAFDAWLRKKVDEEAGYDKIARELLTARLGGNNASARTGAGARAEPTPSAFYAAKQGKPENLAAGTARVFLGIRLECAQCHNHPFAKWKREEFWGYAAFFAGVQKQGPDDGFGAIREVSGRRELAIPGSDKIVQATHLDGAPPAWKPRIEGRALLADWITSPENPYFAKAAVNRVWARFFGVGLVEPVDDMDENNEPTYPELLNEMARQFVSHGYDLKYLIRAITATKAFGLTSAVGHSEPPPPHLYAVMPVRGLSAGQLYDSLAQATGIRDDDGGGMVFNVGGSRSRFLETFANRDESPTEVQTSILQALTLMNGQLVTGATTLESGDTLAAVVEAPYLDTAGRIEALYLAALTRRPRGDEVELLTRYVDSGGTGGDKAQALADVLWALLNGPEFKHNH